MLTDIYALLVWLAQGVIVLFIALVLFDRGLRRDGRRKAEAERLDTGDEAR